ncbi:MAG: metallophosphoesterase [Steroidobacteraceae bacterium]
MLICAAGDIHGAIDRLYTDVAAFEASLGLQFDHVLQVGDFGIWPDPNRIDRATRNHEGAGDFPIWLRENRKPPRPTVFIKGNHEDFTWLDALQDAQVLPGLTYLRNGSTVDIHAQDTGAIRVGGVGGCYGPSDYRRRSDRLQGYAKRHYTLDEIERLSKAGGVDIVLTHDAPAGVRFERHHRGAGYVSESAGMDYLLDRLQPRVCFFGHHHTRIDAVVSGVRCIGLNKVAMPGNLVAIDMKPGKRDISLLGEYAAMGRTSPKVRLSKVSESIRSTPLA